MLSVLFTENIADKATTEINAIKGLSIDDFKNSILSPVTTLMPNNTISTKSAMVIKASLLKEKNSVVTGRKKIGTKRTVMRGTILDTFSSIDVFKLNCFMIKV